MKLVSICATMLLILSSGVSAQQLPVVKAQSQRADIRDGLHFRKGFWHIMPEKRPDRYYVELPGKEHRVIFYTDIDSISFDIAYGGVYDFVVLLNNRDSCFIQLVAAPERSNSYKSTRYSTLQRDDTIPFIVGPGNSMIIKGRVNQSDSLSFRFDLAATSNAINPSSLKKATVRMDGSGKSGAPVSNYNQLRIAGLQWDSLRLEQNESHPEYPEDGLLGNSLFQDKILEINYDKKWIILHDTLPGMDTGYSRHEMILLDGAVPLMQASLATMDTSCTDWFVLNTGEKGNGWINDSTATRFQLYRGVKRIISWGDKLVVKIPELRIANLSFFNVSAVLAKKGTHTHDPNFLGNSLLKRFNVILDNRFGYIYMKPNSLMKEPYDNTVLLIYGSITAAILGLILLIIILTAIIRKRRVRKAARMETSYS